MKIVISPAKSLDYETPLPYNKASQPEFLKEAERLNKILKKKSPKSLAKLMNISESLATLNWQRNQDWELPFTTKNARPCVYAFNGDVYTGLDAYTIPEDKLSTLQNTLIILSGLYGALKPLDLMQPYRLEMGTKMSVGTHKSLHDFWKKKVTKYLNGQLEDNELFLNLASNEYFNAVDTKQLKVPVVTPIFKEWKNDKLKVISFFAKKARGSMVRYIIDHQVETLEGVKGFNYDGYAYSEEHSNPNKNEFVFIR